MKEKSEMVQNERATHAALLIFWIDDTVFEMIDAVSSDDTIYKKLIIL